MTIFYFKDERGNVGDDLNSLIVPAIFNENELANAAYMFIGIGTLLNSKLPNADEYVIFTSGYGYHQGPAFTDKKVTALGLRGPMTLTEMKPFLSQSESDIPLIDGAYLTPELITGKTSQLKNKIGLIPHVDSISVGLWEEVASLGGFELIDPRLSPEAFVSSITSCAYVITEAMHGAILADAYRVPWTGFIAYSHINEAKWQDWAESLNLNVGLQQISPTFRGDLGLPPGDKIKNKAKRILKSCGLYNEAWSPPPQQKSSKSDH